MLLDGLPLPPAKGSKAAAARAAALWQLFHPLKAAAWCSLQWEAPGQAGEEEEGRVPLLTPSRILMSPSPAPSPPSGAPPPRKALPRHHVQGMPRPHPPGRCSAAGRSGAGAGRASRAASVCNQCLQNWLSSFPASSQVSCFPQDPQPTAPCARLSHGRSSELRPWSSAGLPALPTPRAPTKTLSLRGHHQAQAWGHAAPAPLPGGISPLGLVQQLQSYCRAVAARLQPSCPGQPHS